jgi:hypothetical protein
LINFQTGRLHLEQPCALRQDSLLLHVSLMPYYVRISYILRGIFNLANAGIGIVSAGEQRNNRRATHARASKLNVKTAR